MLLVMKKRSDNNGTFRLCNHKTINNIMLCGRYLGAIRKLIAEKIQISIVEMIKWQSIIKTDYLRIPGL